MVLGVGGLSRAGAGFTLTHPDTTHRFLQVVLQDKFLRMGRNKQFEKRLPSFPVRASWSSMGQGV